jgi:hypothetical protein
MFDPGWGYNHDVLGVQAVQVTDHAVPVLTYLINADRINGPFFRQQYMQTFKYS